MIAKTTNNSTNVKPSLQGDLRFNNELRFNNKLRFNNEQVRAAMAFVSHMNHPRDQIRRAKSKPNFGQATNQFTCRTITHGIFVGKNLQFPDSK